MHKKLKTFQTIVDIFFSNSSLKHVRYGKMFEAWPDIFYSNIPWVVVLFLS